MAGGMPDDIAKATDGRVNSGVVVLNSPGTQFRGI
jgi:hypothetical protein